MQGQCKTGRIGFAKLPFVEWPDFEEVSPTIGLTPQFPLPMLAVVDGLEDALAVLGQRVVLGDDQIFRPLGAGQDDGFPVGRRRWLRRVHERQGSGRTGERK